jgi:hypothetical protein
LSESDPGFGKVAGRADIKNPLESSRDSLRIKAFAKVSETLSLEATHSEWNTEYNVLPGSANCGLEKRSDDIDRRINANVIGVVPRRPTKERL